MLLQSQKCWHAAHKELLGHWGQKSLLLVSAKRFGKKKKKEQSYFSTFTNQVTDQPAKENKTFCSQEVNKRLLMRSHFEDFQIKMCVMRGNWLVKATLGINLVKGKEKRLVFFSFRDLCFGRLSCSKYLLAATTSKLLCCWNLLTCSCKSPHGFTRCLGHDGSFLIFISVHHAHNKLKTCSGNLRFGES